MNYHFIDLPYELFISDVKALPLNKVRRKALIDRYNNELYDLSNLKGVDCTRQKGTTNLELIQERKLDAFSELTDLEREIKLVNAQIKRTEKMLNSLDDDFRNLLNEVYFENKTLNLVANERDIPDATNVIRLMKRLYNEQKKG